MEFLKRRLLTGLGMVHTSSFARDTWEDWKNEFDSEFIKFFEINRDSFTLK